CGFFASPAGQVSGMAFFRFAPFRRTWLFVYHAAGRAQGWFPCVPLGWFVAPCLQRDGVWPGRRDGASLTGGDSIGLWWVVHLFGIVLTVNGSGGISTAAAGFRSWRARVDAAEMTFLASLVSDVGEWRGGVGWVGHSLRV